MRDDQVTELFITGRGQLQVTFSNGYTASIGIGPMHYSSNYPNMANIAADLLMGKELAAKWSSTTMEIAVLRPRWKRPTTEQAFIRPPNQFKWWRDDDVEGYVPVQHLLDFLTLVRDLPPAQGYV